MNDDESESQGSSVAIPVATAERADLALARAFPSAGRRQLSRMFEAGEVRRAGVALAKGDRVAPGDVLDVARAPAWGDALQPVPDPDVVFAVVAEHAEFVVVDKPAGIASQPLRATERGTVANGIAARWPECAAIGDDRRDGGLVHRLDTWTSGVLVAARSVAKYRALRDAFAAGQVGKTYLAITCGRPAANACDAPLAQRGKRVAVDYGEGLAAATDFTVERAVTDYALVRCTARTGRMHQIRAHLAHLGAPIVGDQRYGAPALGAPLDRHSATPRVAARFGGAEPIADDGGFYLHAAALSLPGDPEWTAPLPARFVAALTALGLA